MGSSYIVIGYHSWFKIPSFLLMWVKFLLLLTSFFHWWVLHMIKGDLGNIFYFLLLQNCLKMIKKNLNQNVWIPIISVFCLFASHLTKMPLMPFYTLINCYEVKLHVYIVVTLLVKKIPASDNCCLGWNLVYVSRNGGKLDLLIRFFKIIFLSCSKSYPMQL